MSDKKNLWSDLKTDRERADFIRDGRAHETGIIAAAIQSDLANAFDALASIREIYTTEHESKDAFDPPTVGVRNMNGNQETPASRTTVLVGSGRLLGEFGDCVFMDRERGGMWRIVEAANGGYDIFSWNGEGWNYSDNLSRESAESRLSESKEIYGRAFT